MRDNRGSGSFFLFRFFKKIKVVILFCDYQLQRCFTQQLRPTVLSTGAEGSDCALHCLDRNIEEIRGIMESIS